MADSDGESFVAVTAESRADEVLVARDLYRFYHAGDDETFALRGVSIDVDAGEMVAVVGPSGSGKSTLLRCLAGLDEPDGGAVSVAGARLTRRSETERAAIRGHQIGILQQTGNLLEHLSVRANVAMAQGLTIGPKKRTPEQLLGDVGLDHLAVARPSRLSGGEAARAGLAVALANDPLLLLADEPTAEVDEANERLILDLLRAGTTEGGAVVIVTHSTRAAAAADRVIRLSDGRVVDA
jgi:putative ABC transport system ATP-binding protein